MATTSTSSSKRTFSTTPQEWSSRLSRAKVSKHDLNALVANYLFTEGYLEAATHFSREACLQSSLGQDLESIKTRRDIRSCVQRGDIQQALDKVVELDPEILEQNPSLHFSLLQQHLIELIRKGCILQALEFAQTELAPRAEQQQQAGGEDFLKELEKTMALLAFEMPTFTTTTTATTNTASVVSSTSTSTGKKSKKPSTALESSSLSSLPPMPPSLSNLLDPSHRLETCLLLNSSILVSQSREPFSKLPKLFGSLNWGEGLLKEKGGEWDRWELRDNELLQGALMYAEEKNKKEEEEGDEEMIS